MSAYTTDQLDDAVLAGYSFAGVIAALNAGQFDIAGHALKAILDVAIADGVGEDPEDLGELGRLIDRLAVVPVRGVAP